LRRRNGLLGLIACVAIVATASQWGTQQGPVSLLQIDLGQHQAKVTVDAGDTQNGLTAEVQGLSTVRDKLSASLRPLKDFRQMAGPPSRSLGQKQQVYPLLLVFPFLQMYRCITGNLSAAPRIMQLRLVQGPKGSEVVVTSNGSPASTGAPASRGRDLSVPSDSSKSA
jgi:hypothetical protein